MPWRCLRGLSDRSLASRGLGVEIKVPFVENPELANVLPFNATSGSECSRACFARCHEFLPCVNFYLPGPSTFNFSEP